MHYTKGEWKVTKWNKGFGFNVFADEGFVASVPLGTGLIHTMVETQANANLISAAPDMYEALLLAKGTLEAMHITPQDPRYMQIKQAIAKAERKC